MDLDQSGDGLAHRRMVASGRRIDTAEQARQRGGVKLASARRVRDRGWLCAAAIAMACNADPPAAGEATTEPSKDVLAKRECERVREDFTTGECRGVSERWNLLACEDAPPDDPACVEQAPGHRACAAMVAVFAEVHHPGAAFSRQHVNPSQWSCEYPVPLPPPPSRSKSSSFGSFKGPKDLLVPLPPLQGEALIMAACAKQYAVLRSFPNVDRAVLDQVWRSDACRRHHAALLGALSNADRSGWAQMWLADSRERTEPWRLPKGMGSAARDRIVAALDPWCADAPCRVLGRCVAGLLPPEHPIFPGALTCLARDDAACERSEACAVEGRCRFDPTTVTCVPGADDDCARSALCTDRSLCRRIDEPPYGATCGGTTPASSGADTIGFINNPALGIRAAVVEIQSESIEGPHAEVIVGLSPAQLADVSACVELGLAIVPTLSSQITLHVEITGTQPSAVRVHGAYMGVDDVGVFDNCIERAAVGWRFRAAKGDSRLVFSARVHGR